MCIIDDIRRGEGHELDFKRLPNEGASGAEAGCRICE